MSTNTSIKIRVESMDTDGALVIRQVEAKEIERVGVYGINELLDTDFSLRWCVKMYNQAIKALYLAEEREKLQVNLGASGYASLWVAKGRETSFPL